MAGQSALGRLLGTLRRPPHDYRPSTEVFPDLDVSKVAAELNLESLGRERGERNEPVTNSSVADEVEVRIIERIEAENKRSHAILEDEYRTYSERLAGLDFEATFSAVKEAAPSCVGELKAYLYPGLDELHGLRRTLAEHERGREDFRQRNGLVRAPQVRSGASYFLKTGLLAFILLIETVLNGVFLAKGSEQGLIGGISEAFVFAALNVGWAVLVSMFGVVQLNHISWFRKLIGLMSFLIYIGPAMLLNLALAHYREVSGTLVEAAGAEVVERLAVQPWALQDIQSWIFFGLGMLFSVIAFIDGLFLSDPYPGYGGLERRLLKARSMYILRKQELVDELLEVRDRYRDEIVGINEQLSARRSEYDAILVGRSRLTQLFDQHQAHLERCGNALFAIYREANSKARTTEPPPHFSTPFALERIVPIVGTYDRDRTELLRAVKETQELMSEQSRILHLEFERALTRYSQLDDLIPEQRDVAAAA